MDYTYTRRDKAVDLVAKRLPHYGAAGDLGRYNQAWAEQIVGHLAAGGVLASEGRDEWGWISDGQIPSPEGCRASDIDPLVGLSE